MPKATAKADIRYEFDAKPEPGQTLPVGDGTAWLRMPLPFALNHINLWILRDTDGWAVVDTGLGDDASRAHWQALFVSTLKNQPVKRVLVTHMHPDHVGCAGFLTEAFDAPLWMTREEYLYCRVLVADTGRAAPAEGIAFYRAAGYPEAALERYRRMFGYFGRYVTPLPESYHRLRDGQRLAIDGSEWEVIVGRGHSPEHACLYNADSRLLIGGDQLLPSISANVSVYPTEPAANPLAEWLESLAAIRKRVPADVLVLPAHGRPYRGAHERIDELQAEHHTRLAALLDCCATPKRAIDTFPALYRRPVTDDNLMFATGEALAHLNYLAAHGLVTSETDASGVAWYQQA
jgi:glyoxylase-like metal-dependent hydrolase (beta-lactamase superfamily II)